MPKISVIIPIYNSEKYLPRCLDSVCNQTLSDIEIICIDDCSTDNSLEILKEYSQNYPNLIVKHLEKNQGASFARNAGLALATGEYLAFVDSDDEIDLDFYEKLYEKAGEENSDIVRGQAIEITYSGRKNFVPQIEQGNKLFFLNFWLIAIYKRSLIAQNNISFSVNHCLGEDLLFLNQALLAAKDLKLVDGTYYHYYRREDSSDSKVLSEAKIKSALDVYERMIDNINTNVTASDSMYNYIFYRFIMSCFDISFRGEEEQAKQACATAIISIFEKCQNKNALKIFFDSEAPFLFWLLINDDKKRVEDLLLKCKSFPQLIAAGLRFRLKMKMME
jgi:glycosyltransferase involved in cell wall biosynthesis